MYIAFTALCYLIGSIPFGLILTRIFLKTDVRNIGSGNIGATNVMRTGSKKLGVLTLLLDAGKGALAVWIAYQAQLKLDSSLPWFTYATYTAMITVVLGHMFPIWLKFKGGKGVATALGAIGMFGWPPALAACAIWIATFLIFRISALSAIIAFTLLPIIAFILPSFGYPMGFYPYAQTILSILIIAKHHENIKRMLSKNELTFK